MSSVSATLAQADRDAVLQAVATIREKLPFLIDLSNDDRKALPKLGDKMTLPWDNAVAESLFGTLKTEFIYVQNFVAREVTKTAIVEWIEVFYNRQRIHSTLSYLSPVQFEQQYWLSLQHSRAA